MLFTNFCDGGNLEDLVFKTKGGLGEDKATEFLGQLAEGFQAMVKHKIIHRDLKLANIFINKG